MYPVLRAMVSYTDKLISRTINSKKKKVRIRCATYSAWRGDMFGHKECSNAVHKSVDCG